MTSLVTGDTYNSNINGINPRLSQSGEFARDDNHGGVEERSQSSHKRSQVVTTGRKWLEIGTTGQRTIHGVVAACVNARMHTHESFDEKTNKCLNESMGVAIYTHILPSSVRTREQDKHAT